MNYALHMHLSTQQFRCVAKGSFFRSDLYIGVSPLSHFLSSQYIRCHSVGRNCLKSSLMFPCLPAYFVRKLSFLVLYACWNNVSREISIVFLHKRRLLSGIALFPYLPISLCSSHVRISWKSRRRIMLRLRGTLNCRNKLAPTAMPKFAIISSQQKSFIEMAYVYCWTGKLTAERTNECRKCKPIVRWSLHENPPGPQRPQGDAISNWKWGFINHRHQQNGKVLWMARTQMQYLLTSLCSSCASRVVASAWARCFSETRASVRAVPNYTSRSPSIPFI